MTRFYLELECTATDTEGETFEDLFDPIADALYELDNIFDADLAANSADHSFTFTMEVEADDQVAALTLGVAAMRTAIHATGGSTPGWEDVFRMSKSMIKGESRTMQDA